MKKLFFHLLLFISATQLHAQLAPSIIWQKPLGGTRDDLPSSIQQTSDGGFIVSGTSWSFNGDVTGWHVGHNEFGYPFSDYWVVKLDPSGNIQWEKSLGGTEGDYGSSVSQTTDGGYILAGWSGSDDGDVIGYHRLDDYWVVKLDSSGTIQWQKLLGGSYTDQARCIQQTTDGGFIVAGYSFSTDGDVSGHHDGPNFYNADCWIVKMDSSGSIKWQKCLGGSANDMANSIRQTTDGGFIVAGESHSNDGDVNIHYGNSVEPDYWIFKLDSIGNLQWQKDLGGSEMDFPSSVEQTTDGGYIIAGITLSSDVIDFQGLGNCWVVRLDSTGEIKWQRFLGGSDLDAGSSVDQTADGGFIVSGWTYSIDGDVSGNHGLKDGWIVKLDESGNIQWQKCMGGMEYETAECVQQTNDGGFVVAGLCDYDGGDVSGSHGSNDYWIIRLSEEITGIAPAGGMDIFSIYPNPVAASIQIHLPSFQPTTISIFNIPGEKVFESKVSAENVMIDVSMLPAGLYFVKANEFSVCKFVKE